MKRKITVLSLLGVILAGCTSNALDSIQLSLQDKGKIEEGETVTITIKTEPEGKELNTEAFRVTKNAKLSIKDDQLSLIPEETGEFQVTASQDDATSNTLIFDVSKKEETKENTSKETQKTEEPSSTQDKPVQETQKPTEPKPETQTPQKEDQSSSQDTVISWSQSDPLSVDEVLAHGDLLEKSGQSVWLEGNLPQALVNQEMVLYNDGQSASLSLSDPSHLIDFGGTHAMVVGRIEKTESGYQVVVERAYPL